jgi:hypothetical protein
VCPSSSVSESARGSDKHTDCNCGKGSTAMSTSLWAGARACCARQTTTATGQRRVTRLASCPISVQGYAAFGIRRARHGASAPRPCRGPADDAFGRCVEAGMESAAASESPDSVKGRPDQARVLWAIQCHPSQDVPGHGHPRLPRPPPRRHKPARHHPAPGPQLAGRPAATYGCRAATPQECRLGWDQNLAAVLPSRNVGHTRKRLSQARRA